MDAATTAAVAAEAHTSGARALLEKEGFKVLRKGKKYLVPDFQDYLS